MCPSGLHLNEANTSDTEVALLDLRLSVLVDLVYKLKKIVDSNIFSAQFIKIISHYKKIGYRLHARWSTQSRFQLCFPLSLHAHGSDFILYDGSDLKTYLLIRW